MPHYHNDHNQEVNTTSIIGGIVALSHERDNLLRQVDYLQKNRQDVEKVWDAFTEELKENGMSEEDVQEFVGKVNIRMNPADILFSQRQRHRNF